MAAFIDPHDHAVGVYRICSVCGGDAGGIEWLTAGGASAGEFLAVRAGMSTGIVLAERAGIASQRPWRFARPGWS